MPLVSIVTAAYNAALYIGETVESVLAQDYPRLEYIVLDDGSTDETHEVLMRYAGRISSERHENMGETRTVNRGFSLAHGDIVGVVSADDPLLPGAVNAAVERFAKNPDVIVVYPDWEMIDANGEVIDHIVTFDYSYRNMVRWHHCFPGPGTFIRKDVIVKVGGRDPAFRYVADFDFWLHAGLLGPFARLPQTLARYRHHSASASVGQLGPRMAGEHIYMMNKFYSHPDLPQDIRRLRREAYSSAYWIAGVVVGGEHPRARRMYFRKALCLAPHKYLGEYRRSRLWPSIIPAFVGDGRLARSIARLRAGGRRFAAGIGTISGRLRG